MVLMEEYLSKVFLIFNDLKQVRIFYSKFIQVLSVFQRRFSLILYTIYYTIELALKHPIKDTQVCPVCIRRRLKAALPSLRVSETVSK